jgi:hypothetical protein
MHDTQQMVCFEPSQQQLMSFGNKNIRMLARIRKDVRQAYGAHSSLRKPPGPPSEST